MGTLHQLTLLFLCWCAWPYYFLVSCKKLTPLARTVRLLWVFVTAAYVRFMLFDTAAFPAVEIRSMFVFGTFLGYMTLFPPFALFIWVFTAPEE